jgi:hypothetical protein
MWVKLWLNGKERDLKRQHMMLIWKCEPILQSWEVHSRYIFTITLFPWIVWYVALLSQWILQWEHRVFDKILQLIF